MTEREVDRAMSGFTGRRAFGKHSGGAMSKRGEVFKYHDFVSSVAGGSSTDGKGERGAEQ